jgi:hypothetical protein
MRRLFHGNLKTRRTVALSFTVLAILLFAILPQWDAIRPNAPKFSTGVTLISGLGLLMLLGVRRRLPFLPLGGASTWLQIHLYVGIFTAAIYGMHVPRLIAGGVFGGFLSILFLIVLGSGFYGLYASRTLPKKWTAMEDDARRTAGESAAIIRCGVGSNVQLTLQKRLHFWVVVHSLLSCMLLAASIVHVAVVLRLTE